MDYGYAVVPFMAWLIAGISKFVINSVRAGQLAFGQIGYGGLPSNHSAIVTSIAALIAIRQGIDDPVFGVAVAVAFVVMLDAGSLRKQIGKHAEAINLLNMDSESQPLRERVGHSKQEIAAGIVVGILTALLVDFVF